MITIKDMAAMLNLSTTTVSNVIHGKTSEVSKVTVKKVQQMLAEYDYIPNINARNLASNQSKIIGVVLRTRLDKYTNMISDPFMGELIGAIEKEVRKMDYFFMIYISDDMNEIIQYVSTWNADGLILVGMQGDDYERLKERYHKPTLLIDNYAASKAHDCVNIGLDDENGSYLMTNYLIKNGHRKIAFVSDNLVGVDHERYKGFRRSLSDHGMNYSAANLILLKPVKGDVTKSLEELYNLCDRYTALSCASDHYAVTIINYLNDHGMRVPDQISVTGFDDNILSRVCRPAVTTIHQNVTEKGEVSVHTLFRLMNGETALGNIRLSVELIKRDSVKCLTME